MFKVCFSRFSVEQPIIQRVHSFPHNALRYVTDLNWFPSNPPSNDSYDLHTQRIATRCFIVLFILLSIIFLIYTSVVTTIITITVQNPNVVQFNDFSLHYSQSLTCLCTQMSVNYQTFIGINHSIHQVCDSIYVSDQWRKNISNIQEALLNNDFRLIGVLLFQALESLCQLSKDTIRDSLKQFYFTNYISTLATPKDLFESQANATIEQFISATTNSFTLSLQMIRNITQSNALFSALLSNYVLYTMTRPGFLNAAPYIYAAECNCAYTSACFLELGIYHNGSQSRDVWYVPGFYLGCFILEALRQSRLECFYNQTCLEQLSFHLHSDSSMDLLPLNPLELLRFSPNTTLGVIIDAMMVDEWKWSIHHDQYYAVCHPIQCTYTIGNRNNLIGIITTLIGLIGGLITTLKLIVPRLVQFVRWRLKSRTVVVFKPSMSHVVLLNCFSS